MKIYMLVAGCFTYLALVLTSHVRLLIGLIWKFQKFKPMLKISFQTHSGQSIAQILDNPGPLTDADLIRYEGYFNATTGISTQARDDFRSLRLQHWAYLYPIATFVSWIFVFVFQRIFRTG